ncbi:MAG TPA: response regulator, partial [Steroidobacteraceae bacterium]|nr:response regulator [Steroidobacteraceae bacterium]
CGCNREGTPRGMNDPAPIPHGHDAANILLVDDQPARLLTYRAILEPLGHNLVAVNSGLEALEALMKQDFAVVLLDVKMPGMDGFETAALIHDHPRFETTPIIFVTGVHVTEFDRLKGYKAGAIDYVYIPVVPEILRSKVAVLIELDRQRRALQTVNRQLAESNRQLEAANFALQSEKTRELEEFNARLQQANQELSRTNQSLETEVRERIRAETSLKEAVVKRDEFLAMLSHELRNPLSPLRNASHLLMQGDTTDPKIVWSRGVIERQLKHMIRLVDDLLDVSRIARGKIVLLSEPVRLGEVVATAVETVQPLLEQKRQNLQIEAADPELSVRGDAVRLAQVVGNLLHNAAKYTGEEGQIVLLTRARDGRAEIVVQDTGIGIAPEAMPRIFELFTQIPSERASTTGGLGIGLALVRALVELHGGEIHAASAGVDRGSEFTVWLPLLDAMADARAADTITDKGVAAVPVRRNILIADDNQDALESLALMLRMEGHEVHCASDGEEALALAGLRRPEIVVLDVGMPKLDGCEVARRIRAESWGRGAVLVALTGWGQEVDRRRSREAGFDMHLVKPVDPATLCDMLVTQ